MMSRRRSIQFKNFKLFFVDRLQFLKMASPTDDKRITDFFKNHAPERICNFFAASTDKINNMAKEIVLLCCNTIVVHNYQCHIQNKAMRESLEGYKLWRVHVSGGNKSMTIKMSDNLSILSHQVLQMNKFEAADDTDPWKRWILDFLKDTEWDNNFKSLFLGMIYFCR